MTISRLHDDGRLPLYCVHRDQERKHRSNFRGSEDVDLDDRYPDRLPSVQFCKSSLLILLIGM